MALTKPKASLALDESGGEGGERGKRDDKLFNHEKKPGGSQVREKRGRKVDCWALWLCVI